MTYTLYNLDCLELMHTMDAGSIDLTVTSPPYDNLRKYNGYTFDFEPIAQELYRVTKPGGVVVWVVGDQTINGSETGTSFRQALYFMGLGFNLHDTMIYQKVAGATGSNYAYWQAFEYMFVFSRGKPKTINLIADRKNVMPAGIKKEVAGHRNVDGSTKGTRIINRKEYGIRNNIWVLNAGIITDEIALKHPATFPEALARDHILSWSNKGDLVFDPFTGSGTTGKMAIMYGRDFVGSEISEEYCQIAEKRIHDASQQMLLPLDI